MQFPSLASALPKRQDVIAVWFLVLAAISAAIITYGLSAYQVRLRIQTFSVSSTPVTVQQLRRITARANSVPAFGDILRDLNRARNDQKAEKEAADISYFSAEREAIDEIMRIISAIKQKDTAFDYNLPSNPETSEILKARADLLLRTQSAGLSEQLKSSFEVIERTATVLDKVAARSFRAKARIVELDEEIKTRQQEKKSYEWLEVVRTVLADPNLQATQLVRIDDLLAELQSLDKTFAYVGFLLDVPQEFLTLLLVIAAGALGQSIQLIHAYLYATERGQLQNKAIDPFFGAIVALVLFVVVKAGVLIAVDPRGSGQAGAELSPFFVVFQGIVAGFLSNQVVERIRTQGQDWLRATVPQKVRWARSDIQRLIDEKKKDKKPLVQMLDMEESSVEDWLKGETAVPYEIQRIISAWLETPIRDLFSEIPPFRQQPPGQ